MGANNGKQYGSEGKGSSSISSDVSSSTDHTPTQAQKNVATSEGYSRRSDLCVPLRIMTVTSIKGQKTNDSLGEEDYNPENKESERLKRKKYANDINRQSTKEKNANKKLHNLLDNSDNNNKIPSFNHHICLNLKYG